MWESPKNQGNTTHLRCPIRSQFFYLSSRWNIPRISHRECRNSHAYAQGCPIHDPDKPVRGKNWELSPALQVWGRNHLIWFF